MQDTGLGEPSKGHTETRKLCWASAAHPGGLMISTGTERNHVTTVSERAAMLRWRRGQSWETLGMVDVAALSGPISSRCFLRRPTATGEKAQRWDDTNNNFRWGGGAGGAGGAGYDTSPRGLPENPQEYTPCGSAAPASITAEVNCVVHVQRPTVPRHRLTPLRLLRPFFRCRCSRDWATSHPGTGEESVETTVVVCPLHELGGNLVL